MNSNELYDLLLKIQAIARIGLTYSKDPYALTNYQEISDLSKEYLEKLTEVKLDRPNYFDRDIYPTPNVSVRVVIFNEDRTQVLLVREADSKTYSLPGGWADLYDSPAQTAINESRQEAGADIKIVRLVGVMNRTPFKNSVSVPEYLIVFEGELLGPLHEHEYETDNVGWFDVDNLPEICKKVSEYEMKRMIFSAKDKETIFD